MSTDVKWFIQIESATHTGKQAYIAGYGERAAYDPGQTIDKYFAFDSEEKAKTNLQKLLGEWSDFLSEDLLRRLRKAKILPLKDRIHPGSDMKRKDRSIQTPTLEEWIEMEIKNFSGDFLELWKSIELGWRDQLGIEQRTDIWVEILIKLSQNKTNP